MEQHKICESKHQNIEEKVKSNLKTLNKHAERLDVVEREIIAQKKDTIHLQEAIKALKYSIDSLIAEISNLKDKPLEKYEKVAMAIITAIIGYLAGRF